LNKQKDNSKSLWQPAW